MKILEIFILLLSVSLICSKMDSTKTSLSSSNLKKETAKDDVIENLGDIPVHGVAVTNDNYLLQHTAVKNKINYEIKFLKPLRIDQLDILFPNV